MTANPAKREAGWLAEPKLAPCPGNTPVTAVGNFTGNGTSDILFYTSS